MTIEEYAARLVAEWPPWTIAQREAIGALLTAPADVVPTLQSEELGRAS